MNFFPMKKKKKKKVIKSIETVLFENENFHKTKVKSFKMMVYYVIYIFSFAN